MELFASDPDKFISEFSNQFEEQFMDLLKSTESGEWILAKNVYAAVISDKDHVHMNATRWTTLVEFVDHLFSKNLIRRRDEGRHGYSIQFLDIETEQQAEKQQREAKRRLEKEHERELRENAKRMRLVMDSVGSQIPNSSSPTELNRTDPSEKITIKFTPKQPIIKSVDNPSESTIPTASIYQPSQSSTTKTSSVSPWPSPGCIVKIISGDYEGLKGEVMSVVSPSVVKLNLVKTVESVATSESCLETVIPNLNRSVRIVDPKHAMFNKDGILTAVDLDRGLGTVQFSDESEEFRFDHICKIIS